MSITQEPFRKYNLDKKTDAFSIRLNEEERKQFEEDKQILEQVKDGTAMKQLAHIGSIVIHSKKMTAIIDTLFKNKRNNKRLNIVEFD